MRTIRLDRNETQKRFSSRLGVSVPTLRAMGQGDPGVRIGLWVEALWLLDRLDDLDRLLDNVSDEYRVVQRARSKSKCEAYSIIYEHFRNDGYAGKRPHKLLVY